MNINLTLCFWMHILKKMNNFLDLFLKFIRPPNTIHSFQQLDKFKKEKKRIIKISFLKNIFYNALLS